MRSLLMPLAAALLGLAIAGVCALGQSGHQQKEKDKAKGGESTKVPPRPKPVFHPPTPTPVFHPPTPTPVFHPPTPQTRERWNVSVLNAPRATQGRPRNPNIFLGSTAPSGKTTTYTVQDLLIKNSAGLQNDQEKGAFNKLLSGAPLSSGDREILSNTLVSGRELHPEVREFISLGLNSQEPGSDPNSTHLRETRYLRLRNGTQERLSVWLRYYTWTDQQSWVWFPWDPKNATEALSYQLAPAEVTYLKHEDVFISGIMVRLWAQSDSRQWLDYRDRDLWLVPEVDDRNQHYYLADKKEAYLFEFN